MAAQERRRSRAPQLTARNYRFFIRGRSAKAGAGDFVVAARKRAALTAYDKLLRRFRYRWGAQGGACPTGGRCSRAGNGLLVLVSWSWVGAWSVFV
jgi:hypothetical protein